MHFCPMFPGISGCMGQKCTQKCLETNTSQVLGNCGSISPPTPPPGHASHLCTLYNCTWCLVWRRVQADLMCGKELEREAAEWRDLYLSKCGRRLPKIWGEDGSCGKMNLPHRQADVDIKYIKRIAALVVGIFLALTSYTRQT